MEWRAALKWAGEKGKTVKVHYDDRDFAFTTDAMKMTGRLIKGKFPCVDAMIPKGSFRTVDADTATLASVVSGIASMSSEYIKPIKITLEPGKLTAESERSDYGDAKQVMPVYVRGDDGTPFRIGFNAAYLGDVLKCAKGHATVRMGFNGALNPALVTFPEELGFTAVVMPLRIEW